MSLNAEGFIVLDATAAAENGVPQSYISFIQGNIAEMNLMLEHENAYVTEYFSVVIPLSKARASGENKIVRYVHGLTEIYMDTVVTNKLIGRMEETSDFIEGVDMAAYLASQQGTPFANELSVLTSTLNLVSSIDKKLIEIAAAPGTGTVMSVLDDGTTAVPGFWFSPQ